MIYDIIKNNLLLVACSSKTLCQAGSNVLYSVWVATWEQAHLSVEHKNAIFSFHEMEKCSICVFCHPGVVQLENTVGVGRPSHVSRNKALRSINPGHSMEKTKNKTYIDSHNTAVVY